MTETFDHGYALLIGVGESAYPKWSLPVTVKDTQALYAALVDPNLCAYADDEDRIRVLNDDKATRSAILDGLSWLKMKAAVDSAATVLVYYSGHGWLEDASQQYYLLQHDIEPFDLPGSALSAADFTAALGQIQAERLLVVLDCCHAGGMATAKDDEEARETVPPLKLPPGFAALSPVAAKGLIATLTQGQGRAVFASSRGEQQSWIKDASNSIYTYHLLEALQGAGNRPGDRQVRLSDLMNYLGKAVPQTARQLYDAEQTPWFELGAEDFAIALLQGGKGLPDRGWEAVQPAATEKINQIAQTIHQHGKYITNINQVQQVQNFHIGDG